MRTSDILLFCIFIILGSLSFLAAVFNAKWFFKSNGASMWIKWLGLNGARILYGLLGLVLIVCGVYGMLFPR
jgi:hypothetical protein